MRLSRPDSERLGGYVEDVTFPSECSAKSLEDFKHERGIV